jgi:peptide deformylase
MSDSIEILQLGHPVLRTQAAKVEEVKSTETADMIQQLLDTLANSQGVGLAAPQIGYSVCAMVVASKPTRRYPNAPLMPPEVMLNPHFQPLSDEQEKDWEGCLSIPGIRALVPRYKHISVTYTDLQGAQNSLELTDFVARIFQHEYDHLHGLVYLDRVENNQDIISETEFFKRLAA